MISSLKRRIVPEHYKYSTRSYSQEGEDILLSRLLPPRRSGFFVDIGSHHPFRFSNTFLFYRLGWRGINVDPIPGMKALFDKYRPNDINLECAVGNSNSPLNYIMYNEPALNGFNENRIQELQNLGYKVAGKIEVPILPLSEILVKYVAQKQEIDFMSIDVEGFEMSVLESNDWSRFKPKLILAESLRTGLDEVSAAETSQFLAMLDYEPIAKTLNTVFYRLKA